MSQPLRIAMFVGMFPVVSETFILRQIKALLDLGHQVEIFAETRGDTTGPLHSEVAACRLLERTTFLDLPPEAAPWELPVRPLCGRTWVPGASAPMLNAVRLLQAIPHFCRCLAVAPRLTRKVLSRAHYGFQAESLSALFRLSSLTRRSCRFDVLHAHFGPIGSSFRFARELWQAPLVVSFHGYDFCTKPRQQGAAIYTRLFAEAERITANSQFTAERLQGLGCAAPKIYRLPMGLDLGKFPFRERAWPGHAPVRLLTVARLVEIKGHEFALRAVARLAATHDIRYDIVGDGPLRQRLEKLVAELGLQDVVVLHGARDGAFIEDLLAAAHIGVLASVNIEGDAEGQGLFLQEAQACGLPVVATKHGGLPEGLWPEQSGYLVSERDVEGLADALSRLVKQSDQWPALGRAGRAFIEQRFEIRSLTEQLVEVYRYARNAFGNVSS